MREQLNSKSERKLLFRIILILFGLFLILYLGRDIVTSKPKPTPRPKAEIKPETLSEVKPVKPETSPRKKVEIESIPISIEKPKPESLPGIERPSPETIPLPLEKPKPIEEKLVLETIPTFLPETISLFPWKLKNWETVKESIDYQSNLVFFERYWESHRLGTIKTMSLSDYFTKRLRQQFLFDLSQNLEKERMRRAGGKAISGLIPEIEIPSVPLIGESRINIAGDDRITVGGRSTVLSGGTETGRGTPLFPELKMEQILNLRLDGTIGEKTKVLIDHNSERLESKNKVKLEYTGSEDEIIKKIELGETQLTVPSTYFTGDIPTRKGLFGISTQGALGGLNFYLIASREQSQPQTREFKGRSAIYFDTIYDHEFVKQRFFLIDTIPIEIKELYLYYDDNQPYIPEAKIRAVATIRPEAPEDSIPNADFPEDYKKSSFMLLGRNRDYKLHFLNFARGEMPVLEVLRDVSGGRLACSYITEDNDTVGGFKFQDSLTVLKLLKAYRYTPKSQTWDLTLRNIYQLREEKVNLEEVKVFRDEEVDLEFEPTTGKTFLQITGLDPDGDGRVGYPQFLSTQGYFVFPYFRPFSLPELSVRDTIIYTTDPLLPGQGGRYYLLVTYTALSQKISLGLDVEEGTERVYVGGVEQVRGEDYKIDYEKGEITFLKPLPPDADIRVTYEYLPFFMAVSRSVLGTRVEGKFLETGKFGSSLFYRSEVSPQERPTLGSEPFQRMIWESDISYSYLNQSFSNFLDHLPLVRASAPTSFSVSGEIATSFPNPNTYGVAYVDDFEEMVLSEKIDLTAINWFFSSVPVGEDTSNFTSKPLSWFNPLSRIRKDSIFGPRSGTEKEERVDYLKIIYQPDRPTSWAGMMTPIRGGVDIRNLERVEGIFRSTSNEGKILITVATAVEEDIPRRTKDGQIVGYNNFFDTEDRNWNNTLDVLLGEDSGLDTIVGEDNENIPGDDGNDDYSATDNPQGTEGNRRLDSEDIDGNGFSPRGNNHHYEYEINLSDTSYFTNLANNWRLFRIPLRDYLKKEGFPQDQDIRVIRLIFTGFSSPETIDFYALELTGSKWRGAKVEGPTQERQPDTERPRNGGERPELAPDTQEVIQVYQISIENDTSYNSPFPLKVDPFGKREKEASLALAFKELRSQGKAIVSQLLYAKEDWRDYKKLKVYLHKEAHIDPVFIFRIGPDSNNYYQFRSLISQGKSVPEGDGLWYEFEIHLDTFYKIRSENIKKEDYSFTGTPTLSEVRYLALGIENISATRISGTVWFNDIRLISPYQERGLGYRTSAQFSLSDVFNFSLSLSYQDPNFLRLSEGGGVKVGHYAFNQGWSFNANFDRFLPSSWQLFLPLSYSRSLSSLIPKFHPLYSDKRIQKNSSAVEEIKGKNFFESWGANIRKGKSKNKILNYTLDALSFTHQRSRGLSHQYLSKDTSLRTSSGINYGINPNLYFSIGEKEFYYFPKNISFGIGYFSSHSVRSSRISDTAQYTTFRDSTKTASLSFGAAYSPVENLNFDYSENQGRNLYGRTEEGRVSRFGVETDKERNFGASYSLELWDVLSPNFEYDGGYSESRMRQRDTVLKKRTFNNEGEFRIDTDLNLQELFSQLKGEDEDKGKKGKTSWLFDLIEPFDISYSISRSSEFPTASSSPPLAYQLGFIDTYIQDKDTMRPLSRDLDNRFSLSSRLRFGDLGIGYSYETAKERNYTSGIGNANYSTTWPSLNITLGKLERFFKNLATSSNLTSNYQRNFERSGSLSPTGELTNQGQQVGKRDAFSPLIGWQTSWKKRINTNFNINYSLSSNETYVTGPENTLRTETKEQGFDFSISHAFSAPRGIKILFLPKVKLTQEVSLTWDIRYSRRQSNRFEQTGKTTLGLDENVSTRLSASYRISNTVESGFNTGYTSYHNLLTRIHSQSVDLNLWILFRF